MYKQPAFISRDELLTVVSVAQTEALSLLQKQVEGEAVAQEHAEREFRLHQGGIPLWQVNEKHLKSGACIDVRGGMVVDGAMGSGGPRLHRSSTWGPALYTEPELIEELLEGVNREGSDVINRHISAIMRDEFNVADVADLPTEEREQLEALSRTINEKIRTEVRVPSVRVPSEWVQDGVVNNLKVVERYARAGLGLTSPMLHDLKKALRRTNTLPKRLKARPNNTVRRQHSYGVTLGGGMDLWAGTNTRTTRYNEMEIDARCRAVAKRIGNQAIAIPVTDANGVKTNQYVKEFLTRALYNTPAAFYSLLCRLRGLEALGSRFAEKVLEEVTGGRRIGNRSVSTAINLGVPKRRLYRLVSEIEKRVLSTRQTLGGAIDKRTGATKFHTFWNRPENIGDLKFYICYLLDEPALDTAYKPNYYNLCRSVAEAICLEVQGKPRLTSITEVLESLMTGIYTGTKAPRTVIDSTLDTRAANPGIIRMHTAIVPLPTDPEQKYLVILGGMGYEYSIEVNEQNAQQIKPYDLLGVLGAIKYDPVYRTETQVTQIVYRPSTLTQGARVEEWGTPVGVAKSTIVDPYGNTEVVEYERGDMFTDIVEHNGAYSRARLEEVRQ